MRRIIIVGLLSAGMNASAQEFHLPFKGRWFVAQAGDTLNVNQHMSVRAQWLGIDFMKVDGPSQRALSGKDRPSSSDYFSWGQQVLAPADGTVDSVVDGFPDNPIGTRDPNNPAGNYVVIATAKDRYAFIAHLQKGSIRVRKGQKLVAGELLGLCGNSGNSDAPHVHMHVQDTPVLNQGNGQEITFKGINVELTGKIFKGVDWPLIRGLFVWD